MPADLVWFLFLSFLFFKYGSHVISYSHWVVTLVPFWIGQSDINICFHGLNK